MAALIGSCSWSSLLKEKGKEMAFLCLASNILTCSFFLSSRLFQRPIQAPLSMFDGREPLALRLFGVLQARPANIAHNTGLRVNPGTTSTFFWSS